MAASSGDGIVDSSVFYDKRLIFQNVLSECEELRPKVGKQEI